MNQMGAAEWAALSEKERQARLMKLKLQERKLRAEGKYDEATALITEGIKNQEGMHDRKDDHFMIGQNG